MSPFHLTLSVYRSHRRAVTGVASSKNARIAERFVTVGSLVVIAAGAFWFVQRVLAG